MWRLSAPDSRGVAVIVAFRVTVATLQSSAGDERMVVLPGPAHNGLRLGWMDALRGMALTFVIFDHSVANTADKVGDLPGALLFLAGVLDPLRMPLMVFLSGTLLTQSLAKGPRSYLLGKFNNILYPFVIWTWLFTFLWIIAEPITGTPHDLSEFWWNIIDPQSHLWFIYYLFIYYCLMLLLRKVPRMVLIVASFAIAALWTMVDWYDSERFFFLFGFFVLGQHATENAEALGKLLRRRATRLGMVVLALGLPVAALTLETSLRYEPASIPLALGGIGVMLLLANAVGDQAALGVFRHLGRNSLRAYIMHWMIIVAIILVTSRLIGVDDPRIVAVCATAGGFAGTLLAVRLTQVLRLDGLFTWPARLVPHRVL